LAQISAFKGARKLLWYVFPDYRKHNRVTRSKMRRNGRT